MAEIDNERLEEYSSTAIALCIKELDTFFGSGYSRLNQEILLEYLRIRIDDNDPIGK